MADRVETLLERLVLPPAAWIDDTMLRARVRSAMQPAATRESWKYTPIAGFLEAMVPAARAEPSLDGCEQPGVHLSRLADSSDQHREGPGDASTASRFPLADIGFLMTGDGLRLSVDSNARARVEVSFGEGLNMPVLIELAPDAQLTLIERNPAHRFSNHALYLRLASGASLTHARTALTTTCCDWSLTQIEVNSNASYQLYQHQTGGVRRRSETQIIMNGREASAELMGAYRIVEGTHLDQQVTVEHRAPGATSRQVLHGIGTGKGSVTFNGRIHIHPGAPGSDASLSNRNLTLHPDVQINTKPELEIYTDDVKCAHGATIGQLAEDDVFYLRSRGISAAEAKRLLCRAFIKECIDGPLADEASAALLANLTTESTVIG